MDPTAAYLLASRSTPEEVREQAIEKAEAGEHVGPTLVKEMLQQARDQSGESPQRLSVEVLRPRVTRSLDRYLDKCNDSDKSAFAKLLREFADRIAPKETRRSRKKRAK